MYLQNKEVAGVQLASIDENNDQITVPVASYIPHKPLPDLLNGINYIFFFANFMFDHFDKGIFFVFMLLAFVVYINGELFDG